MLPKEDISAAGRYITVRGCAPFTTDSFPGALQKGLAGSYWNVSLGSEGK